MANTLLLIPENTNRRAAGGRLLPEAADNLFTRIIRDPLRGSGDLRERQCTEMLAGLLINAPVMRDEICRYLAKISDCPLDALVVAISPLKPNNLLGRSEMICALKAGTKMAGASD